jgi:hypothetical protein
MREFICNKLARSATSLSSGKSYGVLWSVYRVFEVVIIHIISLGSLIIIFNVNETTVAMEIKLFQENYCSDTAQFYPT